MYAALETTYMVLDKVARKGYFTLSRYNSDSKLHKPNSYGYCHLNPSQSI